VTNPYRDAFYLKQADWHGHDSPQEVENRHKTRSPYYAWFTRGWLPKDPASKILDLGCGAGQFLWYLREAGYSNNSGVDLDAQQVALGQRLGLACRTCSMVDALRQLSGPCGLISALDVLEHFTKEELH